MAPAEKTETAKPAYVKFNADDGTVDITLSRPLVISGAPVGALRMREPLMADQLRMDAAAATPALRELHHFADLCMQAPEDIKQLPVRDYQRLQLAYGFFLD